ncbi:MAG: energy transducer TonB [Bdellovibrionota bacterium]|nr:energy transducer TonB [Bdellovibrionota bacterium]
MKKIVKLNLKSQSKGPVKAKREAQIAGTKRVIKKKKHKKNKLKPIKKVVKAKKKGNSKKNVSAQKASGGGVSLDERMKYIAELTKFIDKNQYYPRRALRMRQTGKVKVKLVINPDGSFKSINVIEESAYSILNSAAENLLIELGSFKPLPKGFKASAEFIVPLVYGIKR